MIEYGCVKDITIPSATRSLVAELVRAVSADLGIPAPRIAWVTDADPARATAEHIRAMGTRRWDWDHPVYGWTDGWTPRTATVYVVWPPSATNDRATIAHELRHVAQRLRGVGPDDPTDIAALEADAEAYARQYLGLPMPPGPSRDTRHDAIPASEEAALLQAERDLHDSIRTDLMGAVNRELYRQRQGAADCGTSAGTRHRYTRATSPVLAARVFGVPIPEGPERRIEHAERFGGPRRP